MSINEELLFQLSDVAGIAGHEVQVRDLFKKETQDYADKYYQDGLGGIFARHIGNSEGPRIMMAAHMDEVGFMVTQITDAGFLKFTPIGGWWSQVVLSQQVEVTTRSGSVYEGVTGSKPPHVLPAAARKKPIDLKDVFVDLGAKDKEEVLAWGIRPGDMITPKIEARRLNDTPYLLGKAWDNRIGVAVAIEVLKYAHTHGHQSILFSGANVQEEVGLRGAKVATHLLKPDLSIALDTGIAGDTPGMTPEEADSKLGKGPQILVYDASMIPHRGFRDFVIDVAEEENIPFQYATIAGGGTDAGAQHQSLDGVPSLAITIPVRYLHSSTSIIHEDDFKYTVQLVNAILSRLNNDTLATIQANA